MTRVLKEAQITTRNARGRLRPGVHWRSIDPDVHLGYRRAAHGGKWLVRYYKGNGAYGQETLATTDDAIDADGEKTLSFAQATIRARRRVEELRAAAVAAAAGPVITVRLAVEDYLAERERREDRDGVKRDARRRLGKHVLSDAKFAATALFALTERALRRWLDDRTGIARATVQRLVNDLKAALNRSARRNRDKLPADLSAIIKNGLSLADHHGNGAAGSETRSGKQVLPDNDVRRIVDAAAEIDDQEDWGGDLSRMVIALAATGARFSQLARAKVVDYQPSQGRLMVPASRKGKRNKGKTHVPFPLGDDVISALRPAARGRAGTEVLLLRPRWKQVGPRKWITVGRGPWGSSAELTRPWAQIVAHAKLSADIVPYSLRHSSIVRSIRAGSPIRLVAEQHDTSVSMIERHYAAFITSALDEIARRAVVPIVPPPRTAKVVVPLRARRG